MGAIGRPADPASEPGDTMHAEYVTIPDPDNPLGSPAYDGPALTAHLRLLPGTYPGTDRDTGAPITLRVANTRAHAAYDHQ